MEESSPDLEGLEGCRSRLAPANSVEPSSPIVVISKDSVHRNATPGQPIKWTDEKHRLYLGNLEASFINQLHGSRGLRGWHSQEKALDPNSIILPSLTCNSHDQFTILHSGFWKKKKFERNEPPLNRVVDSHVNLENPWICHFRSTGKRHIMISSDVQEGRPTSRDGFHSEKMNFSSGPETCPEQLYAYHSTRQDLVDIITEVSDQNFQDEDQGNNPSIPSMAKRFKVDAADTSSNDQVVPSRKLSTTEAIAINKTIPKKRTV